MFIREFTRRVVRRLDKIEKCSARKKQKTVVADVTMTIHAVTMVRNVKAAAGGAHVLVPLDTDHQINTVKGAIEVIEATAIEVIPTVLETRTVGKLW